MRESPAKLSRPSRLSSSPQAAASAPGSELPKQYADAWRQNRAAPHASRRFCRTAAIDASPSRDRRGRRRALRGSDARACRGCCRRSIGGATRQQSVRNGLEALAPTRAGHRAGARRGAALRAARRRSAASSPPATTTHGAIPAMPVTETVKRVEAGVVAATRAARSARDRADAAGLSLRAAARGAPGGGRRPARATSPTTRRSRRSPAFRCASWPATGSNIKLTTPADFAAGGTHARRRWRRAPAQGFDVHAFGPGNVGLALRRRDPARSRPCRPFRRRCRPACADRRAARHDRRRRYRRAFSALRPAMEGRVVRPLPRRRRAPRARARRAHRQPRRDAGLRAAEDRAAPRGDARARRRDRRDRRRPGRA